VWSGQSWLPNTSATPEAYTISGRLAEYTPTNADDTMTADLGVSDDRESYSATVTDLESGTTAIRFRARSDVGLRAGRVRNDARERAVFSVNPADNVYHFAVADVGKTVHVNYSFSLSFIQKQDISVVPSGRDPSHRQSSPAFKADVRVEYYTGPNNGKQLTHASRVGASHSTTGTYTVSGSGPASYKFASGDINAEILITYRVDNSAAIPNGTQKSLAFSLAEGDQGQSAWAVNCTSKFPGAAIGYTKIANVLYAPMDLGIRRERTAKHIRGNHGRRLGRRRRGL
jgi:hypothetical protein